MKHSDRYYAAMADREARDHDVTSKYAGRLYVSEGAFGRAFNRFRPKERKVGVRNVSGHVVWCTPTQILVMTAGRRLEGEKVSATMIAASLGVATSTVTRALLFLSAWKLIAYDVMMGRNGGITFLKMAWADLKMRSRTAWARMQNDRVRAWNRLVKRLEDSLYFTSGLNFATSTAIDATFSEAT